MSRIVWLYLFSVAYAVVRYVAFIPANRANVPVFILNKAVSMAAALCFMVAFWHGWQRRRGRHGSPVPAGSGNDDRAAAWFRAGVVGAVAHVPMSLSILHPSYFEEFFAGGRYTFNGEAVILFGALTAGGLYLLGRASSSWGPAQRWWLSLATVATLLCHTLCMGIARGLNINRDHAYLPPMWLLSVIGAALGLAFLLMSKPRATVAATPRTGELPANVEEPVGNRHE